MATIIHMSTIHPRGNAGAAWNLHLAGVNWSVVLKGLSRPVACAVVLTGVVEFQPLHALYRRVKS